MQSKTLKYFPLIFIVCSHSTISLYGWISIKKSIFFNDNLFLKCALVLYESKFVFQNQNYVLQGIGINYYSAHEIRVKP